MSKMSTAWKYEAMFNDRGIKEVTLHFQVSAVLE